MQTTQTNVKEIVVKEIVPILQRSHHDLISSYGKKETNLSLAWKALVEMEVAIIRLQNL